MTVKHFERSFSQIFGNQVGINAAGETFFVRFYEIFLASSPRVPELFARTNMTRQVTMLRRSLYELVTFYVTGTLSEPLRHVAQVHQHLAITPDLYDRWLDALIATVREFDPECDALTEYGWRLALSAGHHLHENLVRLDARPVRRTLTRPSASLPVSRLSATMYRPGHLQGAVPCLISTRRCS